ncbi:MAG: phosphoribosylaminoimidazolesuccinocarboxamide synthase [Candidatus Heimdallarchaeota archaeon]|nr:phosphoribosylaminoimidazolesuccinocarboxamide synthase [Candidatus Heimdallarchaeota archaeon]
MVVYSGKAKDVTLLEDNKVRITFRDSISAFDGVKIEDLKEKGKINCRTSTILFELLNRYGFATHYLSNLNETEMICRKVEIRPVEIVCRNVTAGSFCKRYGVDKGIEFETPIIEFFLKDDVLHDPLVAKEIAIQLGWVTKEESALMESTTRAVNQVLSVIFERISLKLVDFKLEFGRTDGGELLIADEISADTMRLWEKETGEIKDKDRYRKDLGGVIEHYKDILQRLEEIESHPEIPIKSTAEITIELKKSVLDPAGEVTLRSLQRKGYQGVEEVRIGKSAKISFSLTPSPNLQEIIKEISDSILSNPLIENYTFDFSSGE